MKKFNLSDFKNLSFDEIMGNYEKQAVLERIINRAIVSVHSYKDSFLKLVKFKIYSNEFALNISKSAGLPNILNHNYDDVDYNLLFSSIFGCLNDYHKYCKSILDYLK